MAKTYSCSAKVDLKTIAYSSVGGDGGGTEVAVRDSTLEFTESAAPKIKGFFNGIATVSGSGDILLAHATDPLQGFGDAGYVPPTFDVASKKITMLRFENLDASASITITRKASVGLPIFDTAGDSVTLAPGDIRIFYFKAGTAALTTGSNDALTLSRSGGSPQLAVTVYYGD